MGGLGSGLWLAKAYFYSARRNDRGCERRPGLRGDLHGQASCGSTVVAAKSGRAQDLSHTAIVEKLGQVREKSGLRHLMVESTESGLLNVSHANEIIQRLAN